MNEFSYESHLIQTITSICNLRLHLNAENQKAAINVNSYFEQFNLLTISSELKKLKELLKENDIIHL